jgi:hypothetical protein
MSKNLETNAIRSRYNEALNGLKSNIWKVFGYEHPVLVEGGGYPGVWLECAPLEGLIYGRFDAETARANHDVFFHHQHEDGYLPCWVWKEKSGTGQIQMVVPIAATALETAQLLGDEGFLEKAYSACSRWDAWLARHRNTRGTGLCEAFCEYDTGHDNSPRFAGLPHDCPNEDAKVCPDAGKLPYLAPDLSATVFGGRQALSLMAARLGKNDEAQMWTDRAEETRRLILKHCYDAEEECFYDVDRDGHFVKIRGDVMIRVLGEHVVDQKMFDRIFERHIINPEGFWPPYPLPSIAVSDPLFNQAMPPNCWGGPSQALTALRAPRWMLHYGKEEALNHLMERWLEALLAAPGFMQQLNPWTGEFSGANGYSPAMCVFIDFVDRLRLLKPNSEELTT